ncbi:MAG: hypothetical protein Q8P55_02155 [bacterium]|nr:hypothetical protein [bacterium]
MRTKLISSIILLGIIFNMPSLVAAQEEITPIQAPETVKEAQQFGIQILQGIPGAVKEVWNNQAVPLWSKMWNWFLTIWNQYIFSWIQDWWDRIASLFGQEIEKRQPLLEQEFQKEKEELKQELQEKIPEPGKTLWEHIKGFLPSNETE